MSYLKSIPPWDGVPRLDAWLNGQVTPHQLRDDLYPDVDWLPEEVRQKVEAA